MLKFRSFKQVPGLEAGGLVTSGPYSFSRNPQIVGWGLALLGTSLAGCSGASLLLPAAFYFVHRLHALIEERHLKRTFGEQYRRYRTTVPRFLGLRERASGPDLKNLTSEQTPPEAFDPGFCQIFHQRIYIR